MVDVPKHQRDQPANERQRLQKDGEQRVCFFNCKVCSDLLVLVKDQNYKHVKEVGQKYQILQLRIFLDCFPFLGKDKGE